jgi:molecular chaperone DnaJ
LLTVTPHPIFSRNGDNITLTVPVTFVEATLGADIKVPTLSGDEVTLRLAPGTPTGRVLRVKGKGVTRGSTTGDLLVTIEVQIPQRIDGEALETLKKFADLTQEHNVRGDLKLKALS